MISITGLLPSSGGKIDNIGPCQLWLIMITKAVNSFLRILKADIFHGSTMIFIQSNGIFGGNITTKPTLFLTVSQSEAKLIFTALMFDFTAIKTPSPRVLQV